MRRFSISDEAISAIQRQLRESSVARPFVTLGESSDSLPMTDEFLSALTRGASDDTLAELGRAAHKGLAPIKFYLAVFVYDGDKDQPGDLLEIDGIPFAMVPQMRDLLADYELDFSHGRYVLRKGADVFENLRSLPGATG